MKKLLIGYNNSTLYFSVNDETVSLAAFTKSPEQYEVSEYLEKQFRSYLFHPKSKFRKALPFSRVIDVNAALRNKTFLESLEILQKQFGLKITKNGLAYVE